MISSIGGMGPSQGICIQKYERPIGLPDPKDLPSSESGPRERLNSSVEGMRGFFSSRFQQIKSSLLGQESMVLVGKPTLQEPANKRVLQNFLFGQGNNIEFEDLKDSTGRVIGPIRSAFLRELRVSRYYLNGEIILSVGKDSEAEQHLNKIVQAYEALQNNFEPQAFDNLSLLLTQAITRDVVESIYNQLQKIVTNANRICFYIEKEEKAKLEEAVDVGRVRLMIMMPFKTIGENPESVFVSREIEMPLAELNNNWKDAADVALVAPCTTVVDKYVMGSSIIEE